VVGVVAGTGAVYLVEGVAMENLKRLFAKSKATAKRNTVADNIQQAAAFRLESLLRTHGEALVEALERVKVTIERFGEWDEGCFYYKGVTASELEDPLRIIDALLAAIQKDAGAA
jgi:hypothetical protein